MKEIFKKVSFSILSSVLLLSAISCTGNNASDNPNEIECKICDLDEAAKKIEYEPLAQFTPTLFKKDSFEIVNKTNLADGAYIDTINLNLNNGNHVIVNAVNVDLNKVSIEAGTKNNSHQALVKATPYQQVLDYEKANSGEKVLAACNADFFGSMPVNAFIKDGYIVKDSHNDNGIYDYTNPKADLPASMPMLFGISSSGKQAQIGAIVDDKNVEETVKTKFKYQVDFLKKPDLNDDEKVSITDVDINSTLTSKNSINIIDNKKVKLRPGKLIKVEKAENSNVVKHGKVIEVKSISETEFLEADSEYLYLMIPETINVDVKTDEYIAYYVNSEGDKWQHYDTVLGSRQALVLNGVIPDTVAKENSNGAQTTDIPRTAIGIKPDGTVVVVTIEALRYYDLSTNPADSYGVNLPELAEILRYYGCVMACNFDGGGSTNLLVKEPNKDLAVWTRSADYGSYDLSKSRPVINTLLVVKK